MPHNLVSANKLAEMLGISVDTVWQYTRTGRIPAHRLSQQYLYDPEAVAQALSQEVESSESSHAGISTHKRPFTYQDYLKLPDDGYRYQILDGILVKEPAPYVQHQRVSKRLERTLDNYFAKVDPDGEVLDAPVDVTLSDIDVVQPDLLYVSSQETSIIEERRINGPPHLVVEIVSPSSATKDRVTNRALYERSQVPHFWIVDYENETIECYALYDGRYKLRSAASGSEVLKHPDFPGLRIDLEGIWRKPS